MPALKNPRHEAFAQAVARGMSAAAAHGQVGFQPHRANAATLARKKHISARVAELQEEQLAIHQQATAETLELTGRPEQWRNEDSGTLTSRRPIERSSQVAGSNPQHQPYTNGFADLLQA
jgi:hypothetical protein